MKRLLDFICSLFILIIFLIVILLIGLLVKFKLGSPILFNQKRPGLHGKPFYLYKFRKMTDEKDGMGNPLPDNIRLTSFGKFLRRYSLDELPQLINVIKGDLSLVGPRPLLMEYLPLYTKEQAKRHVVRPGITGWAQVNGRNAISWEEKFKLDVWYVDNQSLILDLRILLLTIMKVMHSEGINQPGNATMDSFKGSKVYCKRGTWMNIAIIGQGGHSKVIQDLISLNSQFHIVAYLDDKFEELMLMDATFIGPILSAEAIIEVFEDVKFIIAIGNNQTRKSIADKLKLPNGRYMTLVHPTATVSSSAKIGQGTVIMAHSVINADTHIGDHTIINTSSVVEHDNELGSFVHVSPNATLTGAVKIKEGVHVGAGATVIPNVEIGEWAVIGAGATVIHPIPSHCTAVGVPAMVKNKQVNEVYK